MYDENLAAAFEVPEITVITGVDITREQVEMCFELGKGTVYHNIPIELEMYQNKFYARPDFCFIFLHKETKLPIGYTIILPLTEDAIFRYMDNKLSFDTIQPGDLSKIQKKACYYLFFDSMVINKQYQTPEMAKLLFSLFTSTLIERIRQFNLCSYIIIDQYTDFELQICKKLQLKHLRGITYTNGKNGNLYGGFFNYELFKGLPASVYNVLEFAFNNDLSKEILSLREDLWEKYRTGITE